MSKLVQTFPIKSYECDEDFSLRVVSLFNLFQHAADMSAAELGFGYDFWAPKGMGWVGTGYHVIIDRLPKWREQVTLTTWPSGITPVTSLRDFEMTDASGKRVLTASSQWVLLDIAKKRPVSTAKHFSFKVTHGRAIETDFPKLPDVERVDFEKTITVDFDHIDFNHHVNNANYPLWASQAVPPEFLRTHRPVELIVAFKRPAVQGDRIVIATQQEGLETRHSLRSPDNATEYARVVIRWTAK